MKVLGIDPGIARLGWGVIRETSNKQKIVACGCLTTEKQISDHQRLAYLFKQLQGLIKQYKPEIVAVEDLFFSSNAKTAFQVGQARGIVLLAAALQGLPVVSYTPLKIKMTIVGYGRASKEQVQKMVNSMLKLKVIPRLDDTIDALAVALTHCFLRKFEEKINNKFKY